MHVAFTLTAGTLVIDVPGPQEVVQNVRIAGECPFELYTVSATMDLVLMKVKMHRHQRFIDGGYVITAAGMSVCICISLHKVIA